MERKLKNAVLVVLLTPLIGFSLYQLYRAATVHVIHAKLEIPLAEAPGAFVFVVLLYVAGVCMLSYGLYGALTNWKNMLRK